MSDLVWWTAFFILLVLLTISSVRLCTSVICDVCCDQDMHSEEEIDDNELIRYQDSHALYEQFKRNLNNDTTDAVETRPFNREEPIVVVENREWENQQPIGNNLVQYYQPINQIEHPEGSASEPLYVQMKENQESVNKFTLPMIIEPESSSTNQNISVNEQENPQVDLTEEEVEIRDKIESIRADVRHSAQKIPYVHGSIKDLPYLDVNEELLRSLISLSQIDCSDSDDMKKRKKEVAEFARKCQFELRAKAKD